MALSVLRNSITNWFFFLFILMPSKKLKIIFEAQSQNLCDSLSQVLKVLIFIFYFIAISY